jgi:hypothetical protein
MLLSLVGLDRLGVADERGLLAFFLGAFGALCVGPSRPAKEAQGERRRTNWLAFSAVLMGLGVGLGLFGVWYWQPIPIERSDAPFFAAVFVGFGLFAGMVSAAVVALLGPAGRS